MKIVQINSVCESGSTGKICVAISKLLVEHDIENYIFYAIGNSSYPLGIKYMSSFEVKLQALKARVFGNWGFYSKAATRRMLKEIEAISPDVVHLHNLHSHNVNLQMLFTYLKKKQIKVFWTFHDCFAFTSYCMYFDTVQCDKWKSGCEACPQSSKYSWFFDKSKELYERKKELFSNLDLTIITPSCWLEDLSKNSFLKNHSIKVIHNGIDLNLFSPRKSDFRRNYTIPEGKILLLGVANKWEDRKGLDVFIRLSEELDENKFQIVLVGTNDEIDKRLSNKIISIHRTANQKELAEIYSAADFFVNPTKEDNFPTVNIEAMACGTPVITFDTGGSPESLAEGCGFVVEYDNFDELYRLLNSTDISVSKEACLKRAAEFNQYNKFKEYINLYCCVNKE